MIIIWKLITGVDYMKFKERVRELRVENKLTQQNLADTLNSSRSKVGMWESGDREPSNDDLMLLSETFDVSIDYLLGNTNQKKYDTEISAFNAVNTDGLSDEDIEAVRSIVEALKKKHGK